MTVIMELEIMKEILELGIRMDFTYTGLNYYSHCPAEPLLPLLFALVSIVVIKMNAPDLEKNDSEDYCDASVYVRSVLFVLFHWIALLFFAFYFGLREVIIKRRVVNRQTNTSLESTRRRKVKN
uniref:Uncharacterized protein n=1 Tax=Strigamia maritima TaxID=126957 RepID=T1ILV4_STRMM